jgi:hypothetical protein
MEKYLRLVFNGIVVAALIYCPLAAAGQSAAQTMGDPGPAPVVQQPTRRNIFALTSPSTVVNHQNAPALSSREKLRLALEQFTNAAAVAEAAGKAQYYRIYNRPDEIGSGGTGYLKQWGAAYLDQVSGSMFETFIYPSILHQDPRFFRMGRGSIARRVGYCLSRVFVTRNDQGRNVFNTSAVLGSATATVVSNLYYPRRGRDAAQTVGNFGWSLLGNAGDNVWMEFWPDFIRKVRHGL